MLEPVTLYDTDKGISIEAYSDGYAHDEYYLYLVSLAGPDSAVKAITSALLSNIRIEFPKKDLSIGIAYWNKHKIFSSKLSCGWLHQIIVSEDFFHGALVYCNGTKPETALYHILSRRHSLIALPDWASWLYVRLGRESMIEELAGSAKVLRLNVNEEQLDQIVSEAIAKKKLSF